MDDGVEREVFEEYPHNCRIVRKINEDGPDVFNFSGPLRFIKSFENPDKARLFADVYEIVDGFREEKTGERGAPPAVAQAGQNVQIAYYVSQPTMSVEWAAGQYGISEEQVRRVVDLIREQAAEMREGHDD